MGIGRRFEDALQKALRMLDIGVCGLVGNDHLRYADLDKELSQPTPDRVFAIAEAMKRGYPIDLVHRLSHIDKWFLYKIHALVELEGQLREGSGQTCPEELLLEAKRAGFADRQIARMLGLQEMQVREQRGKYGIVPCVKQIDTLAAEYPAHTNYLYL